MNRNKTFREETSRMDRIRQYWREVDEENDAYAAYKSNSLEKEASGAGATIAQGGKINAENLQSASTQSMACMDESANGNGLTQNMQASQGQPLEDHVRAEMEDRMGVDLDEVRIHTGGAAQQMNEDAGANAFTYGQDIYFNKGNYNPNTRGGKELLAHELVHTVQQKKGKPGMQCSVKFEIQTSNYVYAVKKQGTTSNTSYKGLPMLLPRKFGTHSTSYADPAGSQESGPAYLSRGLEGEVPGDFIEMKKGPAVMDKVKNDKGLEAQFIKNYRFTKNTKKEDILGKKLTDGQLELISQSESAPGSFNPNTFEFNYFNDDRVTPIDIHLDERNFFRDGHVKQMKVKKQDLTELDEKKEAQYVKIYKVIPSPQGVYTDLESNKVNVELVYTIDNKSVPDMEGMYYANETQSKYYNELSFDESNKLLSDAKALKVHINEADKKFEKGKDEPIHMQPQYLEIYEVPDSENGVTHLIGKQAVIAQVGATIDNTKNAAYLNKVYKGTWKRKYYKPSDFENGVLKPDAQNLQVYVDNDGLLQEGHIPFLEKVPKLKGEEDAATIEIQSEHGGYLEFETPKWFRKWEDAEVLVQEAVDFTKAIDNSADAHENVRDEILKLHKLSVGQAKVKEWPAGYSTSHLTKLKADDRKLVVLVVDPQWYGAIQGSESIELSDYHSLATSYEGTGTANFLLNDLTTPIFNLMFNKVNDEIKAANKITESDNQAQSSNKPLKPELEESLYGNLKGFVELVYDYIFRAQVIDMVGSNSKSTYTLMARTNFASMYKNLLSPDEKKLFKMMLGDPLKTDDNPFFTTVLESKIDQLRQSNKITWQTTLAQKELALTTETDLDVKKRLGKEIEDLKGKISRVPANGDITRTTKFWYSGVGTSSTTTQGPAIYDWLVGFSKDKDPVDLIETTGGLSAAMGGKKVETNVGDKDYKQAKFEIRGSNFTTTSAGRLIQGRGQPAAAWVEYTKLMFDSAMTRSNDAPDDLTTGKNEASKTGLEEK